MRGPSSGSRGLSRRHTPAAAAAAVVVLLLLAPLVLLAGSCGQSTKTIGVFQFGPDPDTESAYRGLVAGLAEQGYTLGENLRIERRDCGGTRPPSKALPAPSPPPSWTP